MILLLLNLNSNFVLVGQTKKPWPRDGNKLIFLPGSTVKIRWKFQVSDISEVRYRYWSFASSDGRIKEELAEASRNDNPVILTSRLTGVGIEGKATLVLKNINESYDGVYKFGLTTVNVVGSSEVRLIVAGTFFILLYLCFIYFTSDELFYYIPAISSVNINCSNTLTVNKTDDITCLCEGKGGKPPANVTWYYENGAKISETGNETQVLKLRNVNKSNRGTYTCEAKSYEGVENKTTIKLNVNCEYSGFSDKTI